MAIIYVHKGNKMPYSFLTTATLEKLASGDIWLKQTNDKKIIDVSLNAGQLAIGESYNDNDFVSLAQHLHTYCQHLANQFPFIEFFEQQEFHSTLLTIFNQYETQFQQQKPVLLTWCQHIATLFNQIKSIDILFNETVLTSNGSVILTGISQKLALFRQLVYQQIPIDNTLHKNIIHITLGRLREDTPSVQIKSFYEYIKTHQFRKNDIFAHHPIDIHYPKFVVSRGSLSSEVMTDMTKEFNSLWSK